jgi:lysophospholipase L1-like esterase
MSTRLAQQINDFGTATAPVRLRSRWRAAILNLLALGAGVLGALLVLELLLQVHNPFLARIKGNRIVLLTKKQFHIRNYTIPSLDKEITMTRNSIGFRGEDPPADFANHLTIFTVGGSTTQCFYLSDDKTWAARLGDELSQSFRGVWINNAGLDGHSTSGHIVLMEDHIAKFHPKIVYFLIGTNDINKDSHAGVADGENVKGPLVFRTPTTFLRTLSAYSEVAALIGNLDRSWSAYRRGVLHKYIDLRKQGNVDVSEDFRHEFLAQYAGIYLQGFEDRIRRLVQISRDAQITPVLITQPLAVGSGIDDVTGVDLARIQIVDRPGVNGQLFWELHEMYNDATRRVAEEERVMLVDLGRELPKTSHYFYDYMHFTNEGAQAVADILYRDTCPGLQQTFPRYASRACAK